MPEALALLLEYGWSESFAKVNDGVAVERVEALVSRQPHITISTITVATVTSMTMAIMIITIATP